MKANYWIYFLKKWGLLIVIITIIGVFSSSYLIKPKYTNSVLMQFKNNSTNSSGKREDISLYHQAVNNMDVYNRITIFKDDLPSYISDNIGNIQKNINIIQNIRNKTFLIKYTSSNENEVNEVLNKYTNLIVEKHRAIDTYQIVKQGLGQIHIASQTIYKVLFGMLGIFLGIILSICLDMLFCKNKKITGGRRRR